MKTFKARIDIMPHKELLDPQGKTVSKNMHHLNIHGVQDVRIGKHIEMLLEASDETAARAIVEDSCKKLLANLITETYSYAIDEQ
ncbi:MAG TPA: phosphoribosylformylglycinamidine synthase subunit PurS [Saprospiraceae bacterium]|nr:phosphoribosylformylglycinamidine synthase subunit PurS [Saprospiraceae bacterium]